MFSDLCVVGEGEVGSSIDGGLESLVVDQRPGAAVAELVHHRVGGLKRQRDHVLHRSCGQGEEIMPDTRNLLVKAYEHYRQWTSVYLIEMDQEAQFSLFDIGWVDAAV